MKNPWMPFYVADYLADTVHLSAAQHGAYLLLIMHYWRQGSLPKDDAALARIARMSRHEWAGARRVVRAFFDESMSHKRIDSELSRCAKVSSVRQKVGAIGGRSKALKNKEVTVVNATDLPPHLPEVCSSKTPSKRPSKNVDTSQTLPNGRVTHTPLPNGKGPKVPVSEVPIETAEFKVYRLGREILGDNSGGLITRLVASTGSIPQACAALEVASEKYDRREYINGVIRKRKQGSPSGATDDMIT